METETQTFTAIQPPQPAMAADHEPNRYSQYEVLRRNGAHTAFMPDKISVALTKAFLAAEGGQAAASRRVHEQWPGSPSRSWPACSAACPVAG